MTPTLTEILTVGIVCFKKIGYICAELRKPVEDTVYRKVLSKRAIGDIGSLGYVYFAEMHLPPELSTNPSLTFIKIGKSGDPGVRLSNLQTANPVDYISHRYGSGGRYSPYGTPKLSRPW